MSNTIDLSKLSAKDLKAEIARREDAEFNLKNQKVLAHQKRKETFVNDTVAEFRALRERLKTVKQVAISNGNTIYAEMFEVQGKATKKVKQFTLTNADKSAKIVVDHSEIFGFTDEAIVAIDSIKDFFKNKFENRSKLVYSLLDTLLIKNGKGDYDAKLLTKLRSQVKSIDAPDLTEAFELLERSQIVTGSALYLRAYEKNSQGKMRDIVIQFSSL